MRSEDDSQDRKNSSFPEHPKNWAEINKKLLEKHHISIKPYTLKELADIYKVSVPTFKRKLAPYEHRLGEHAGRYYSIGQVKLIFQYVDLPSPYTLCDLVMLYEVSPPTFKTWLSKFENELGEKQGHFYSFRQLYIIITKLDIPVTQGKEESDLLDLLRICNGNMVLFYCSLLGAFAL